MSKITLLILVFLSSLFTGCEKDEDPPHGSLILQQVFIGPLELSLSGAVNTGLPVDRPITLVFSMPVDTTVSKNAITLKGEAGIGPVDTNINFSSQNKSVIIYPAGALENNTTYTVALEPGVKGSNGQMFEPLEVRFRTEAGEFEITLISIAGKEVNKGRVSNVPVNLKMTVNFSLPVKKGSLEDAVEISGPGNSPLEIIYLNNRKTAEITTSAELQYLSKYDFSISDALEGTGGETFAGFSTTLYTQIDSTFKAPVIADEELLTKIQKETFKYFWDFAHPTSGLARERNTSGDVVTVGGSGFGVMSILVGIERGFITRKEGTERLLKIVTFLAAADRFHGVWPHWINGDDGSVVPFSPKDNGGDLVETALMIQGLLTVREYLEPSNPQEAEIINIITRLWEEVEWDWFTRGGQNVLYWHWSPEYHWEKNLPVRGWNEGLIVYVLAAASPTHPIDPEVYHEGWARDGQMKNGNSYYGIELPLGPPYGGPLFFAHYSFLGLDPRNLEDQYADYWEQNVNHTLINWQHAIANPQNFVGYGRHAWGFTASDDHEGYAAHSPRNDKGVITPTAALSSMPYTPHESMSALKHFYYLMGDKLWGEYGFKDAYNPTAQWYASSYLAIDQGPIILMIENHRTGLLWDHFMSNAEIRNALKKLGFSFN